MYAAWELGQVTNEMKKMDYPSYESARHDAAGSGQQRLATGELLLHSRYEKKNAPITASLQINAKRTNWTGGARLPYHYDFLQDKRIVMSHYNLQMTVIIRSRRISTADFCPTFRAAQMGDLNAKGVCGNTGYEKTSKEYTKGIIERLSSTTVVHATCENNIKHMQHTQRPIKW